MKKDENIAKIFDSEVVQEPVKQELLEPALHELQRMNAKKKAATQRRWTIVTAACACAAVVVIALSVILPQFAPKKSAGSAPPLAPSYYFASQISQAAEISESAKAALPTFTHINGNDVLPESIEEYKFQDGTTAFITATFRRQSRYGIEEVRITAEFADDVYEDFEDYFAILSDGFRFISGYEDGEYIGKCAVEKDGVKYYIDIMSPKNIDFSYYRKLFE